MIWIIAASKYDDKPSTTTISSVEKPLLDRFS